MRNLIVLSIIILFNQHVEAQNIPDFTLKNVQSGNEVTLSDYKDEKGVVIIFISNVCPYAVYYEGRITQLIADYEKEGIPFLLINSHTENKESEAEMANKITAWGLNVPYLADKEQMVLSTFGAKKSPEAYILKNNNGQFSVFYKGAIDNNPQVASDVKKQYLKENIERLLKNQPAVTGGRPIGCMVKPN